MYRLRDCDERVILNCLRVAAERFAESAKTFTQLADAPRKEPAPPRIDEASGVTYVEVGPPTPAACRMLAQTFSAQATEAYALANAIEMRGGLIAY